MKWPYNDSASCCVSLLWSVVTAKGTERRPGAGAGDHIQSCREQIHNQKERRTWVKKKKNIQFDQFLFIIIKFFSFSDKIILQSQELFLHLYLQLASGSTVSDRGWASLWNLAAEPNIALRLSNIMTLYLSQQYIGVSWTNVSIILSFPLQRRQFQCLGCTSSICKYSAAHWKYLMVKHEHVTLWQGYIAFYYL